MQDSKTFGTLYLCPTPIGNLGDMTERAKEVLQSVDVIAAEDTRNSLHLLQAFDIRTPMLSYHKFNEQDRSEEILDRLRQGQNVALITDAGMPAISDPGQILVKKAHEAHLPVTALPGPCAFVTALALSGMDSRSFVFEGFLPTDHKEADEVLARLHNATQTTLFYEAPHRLIKTLGAFASVTGDRVLCCVREISKKHEEIVFGTAKDLMDRYSSKEPRGEFVVIVEGLSKEQSLERSKQSFEKLSIWEHAALYPEMDEKERMKRVAKERGISRQDVYKALKIEGKQ